MQLHQQSASSKGFERKLLELSGNAVIPHWQQESQMWRMPVCKCLCSIVSKVEPETQLKEVSQW